MTRERLARIEQTLTDFSTNTIGWLKGIDTQCKKTNGRVNKHDTKLELLNNNQLNCPARTYFNGETRSIKWGRIGMVAAIILNTIVVIITFIKT